MTKKERFLDLIKTYGPKVGPFCLGGLALTGVFARGLVNFFFALLLAWALAMILVKAIYESIPTLKKLSSPFPRLWVYESKPKKDLLTTPLPRLWLIGLSIFILTYGLATLTSHDIGRSLFYTGELIYLLCAFPVVWLVLNLYPKIYRSIAALYGLGLIILAFMTLSEASWCLSCIRAKGHLGIIEVGAILGQLPPVMVGAIALSLRKKKKYWAIFFLLTLVASFLALRVNCSRIGFIAAPTLSAFIFFVNRKFFTFKAKIIAAILVALALVLTLSDTTTTGRFQEMTVAKGNANNDLRKAFWRQGIETFLSHPVLGSGPGAIPGMAAEKIPPMPDGSPSWRKVPYSHTHQIFITVLAESGVIGFLGFLALHLAPLILIRRNLTSPDPEIFFWSWSAIAVTGQFVLNGLTDHIFGLKPMMYIYWTVTAIAIWLPTSPKDSRDYLEPSDGW
ncbi:MAG: O-antigen ligase family protein [Deltaproteobacteria bacterium]|jgi:O-antigen ligase|nr:O-antigen ligase family protein [Deltaproteobacteria bacterium]